MVVELAGALSLFMIDINRLNTVASLGYNEFTNTEPSNSGCLEAYEVDMVELCIATRGNRSCEMSPS